MTLQELSVAVALMVMSNRFSIPACSGDQETVSGDPLAENLEEATLEANAWTRDIFYRYEWLFRCGRELTKEEISPTMRLLTRLFHSDVEALEQLRKMAQ